MQEVSDASLQVVLQSAQPVGSQHCNSAVSDAFDVTTTPSTSDAFGITSTHCPVGAANFSRLWLCGRSCDSDGFNVTKTPSTSDVLVVKRRVQRGNNDFNK